MFVVKNVVKVSQKLKQKTSQLQCACTESSSNFFLPYSYNMWVSEINVWATKPRGHWSAPHIILTFFIRGRVIDAKTNLVCQCFTAAFLHLASLILAAEAAAATTGPIINRRRRRPHVALSHLSFVSCTVHPVPVSLDRTAHFRPPRVICVLLHTSPLLYRRAVMVRTRLSGWKYLGHGRQRRRGDATDAVRRRQRAVAAWTRGRWEFWLRED